MPWDGGETRVRLDYPSIFGIREALVTLPEKSVNRFSHVRGLGTEHS